MAPPGFDFTERGDGSGIYQVISGAAVPLGADFMSLIIAMTSISILSICLYQRMSTIEKWSNVPFVVWLTFAIYTDSVLFVVGTTILQQIFGLNTGMKTCLGAVWLCLTCYITTKFIYMFLVEKAHIIRGTQKKRLKSKLYIFNSFGMLGCYAIIAVFNFIFHIAKIDTKGVCIIGLKTKVVVLLITFDAVVNIYLTILFLIPLRNLYTFKSMPKTQANVRLRSVAFRTFIGSCCTLLSSILNLTVLMALQGEPGWVCLLCCTSDVLFSALVIQWVTSKDNAGSNGQTSNGPATYPENGSRAHRDPMSSARMGKSITTTNATTGRGTDSEISLVEIPTAPASEHGEIDMSKGSSLAGGGAVMVTTTIHRQSLPSGFDIAQHGSPLGSESGDLDYGYTSRSAGYGSNGHDVPEPPRTHITAGKNNHI